MEPKAGTECCVAGASLTNQAPARPHRLAALFKCTSHGRYAGRPVIPNVPTQGRQRLNQRCCLISRINVA
uniref:Uncharacterized protein n=1 Tax=Arundo donax TaxID=35708 RepID=A0A0A9TN14_ARUDO